MTWKSECVLDVIRAMVGIYDGCTNLSMFPEINVVYARENMPKYIKAYN